MSWAPIDGQLGTSDGLWTGSRSYYIDRTMPLDHTRRSKSDGSLPRESHLSYVVTLGFQYPCKSIGPVPLFFKLQESVVGWLLDMRVLPRHDNGGKHPGSLNRRSLIQ